MNKPFKTVKMFGPSLSNPSRVVNVDVAEGNVQAFTAAGYQLGSIEVEEVAEEAPKVTKAKGKK